MLNVFDLVDATQDKTRQLLVGNTESAARNQSKLVTDTSRTTLQTGELMMRGAARQFQDKLMQDCTGIHDGLDRLNTAAREIFACPDSGRMLESLKVYMDDAGQRLVLALDVLRRRGDIFLAHEDDGCPPVLMYQYDVVIDGANLPRPCSYMLLRIQPPDGIDIDPTRRPYIIIDPRAGHGAGIGGFKADSQVGVALRAKHPVYFVSFRRDPHPQQSLADVTRAEAEFVREVSRRHPDAPKPVVIGNCQGGWATLILAATNPDLTGPIVLNGSPVATWSGTIGTYPMRYNGGLLGGTWLAMLLSDIGNGLFDGAHLVLNFELLNPSRNFFGKYYDLYRNVDSEGPRFLEFETWWGGFFLLNEAEIRWIVEQLFVGNRLAKNEARLEPGRNIDIKHVRSPIIVFTSQGDNITPPQQALNWIVDTYADVSEIRIRGQRIIYMVHDQVGHLGIFVSSKIAKREHTEVASTMETIEALAPGLYEMRIEDYEGEVGQRTFTVSFQERTFADLRAIDDGREDEFAFAAVARSSELQAQFYDIFMRPLVQACVNPLSAEMSRALHPLRLQRALFSTRNPLVGPLAGAAERVNAERRPATQDNPFVRLERSWAELIEQSIDLARDLRDAWYEMAFFWIWGTPWAHAFGHTHQLRRTLKNASELRALSEVMSAIRNMAHGGFIEAVIRMLILLAESRGNVRRDRLERSAQLLTENEPFRSLSAEQRKKIIDEQTLLVQFEPEQAIDTLPRLLTTPEERELAVEVAQYVPGLISEMAPHTLDMLQRFRRVLGLPPISTDVMDNPLAKPIPVKKPSEIAAE